MTVSLGPSRRIVASAHYKWLAYGAIATGIFLTVMDQSGVNLAVPRIAERFVLDIPTAQWIVLGYVLSTSALLLPMGRVSDMLGRERVFMSGLVGFIALGSAGRRVTELPGADRCQGAAGSRSSRDPGERDGDDHGRLPEVGPRPGHRHVHDDHRHRVHHRAHRRRAAGQRSRLAGGILCGCPGRAHGLPGGSAGAASAQGLLGRPGAGAAPSTGRARYSPRGRWSPF